MIKIQNNSLIQSKYISYTVDFIVNTGVELNAFFYSLDQKSIVIDEFRIKYINWLLDPTMSI